MNGFNFTPEQMKMASQYMQSMKDEDIQNMTKNMGMGNIDPSFLKSMAANMGSGGGFPPRGGFPNPGNFSQPNPPPSFSRTQSSPADYTPNTASSADSPTKIR